jgi:hypothetical protein
MASSEADRRRDFADKIRLLVIDKAVIGLVLVLAGLIASTQLEIFKSDSVARQERIRERRAVISRQLGEFYRPLQFHLAFDTAIWEPRLMYDPDPIYAWAVRTEVVLPNHLETFELIMKSSSLAQNPWERADDPKIIRFQAEAFKYARHVAIFKTLVSTKRKDDPISKREPFRTEFIDAVNDRIAQLVDQYNNPERDMK